MIPCQVALAFMNCISHMLLIAHHRSLSQSYSTRDEKHLGKLTNLTVGSRRYDTRGPDSPGIKEVLSHTNQFYQQEILELLKYHDSY